MQPTPNTPAGYALRGQGTEVVVAAGQATPPLSARQECASETAARRGLAEYLLLQNPRGARDFQLRAAYWDISTWGNVAHYPAIFVGTDGVVSYDATGFGTTPEAGVRVSEGVWATIVADATANLIVEVWATDPVQRDTLVSAFEALLFPEGNGLQLVLPWYNNGIATYTLRALEIGDDVGEAKERRRLAVLHIECTLPMVRIFHYPEARARLDLTVAVSDAQT